MRPGLHWCDRGCRIVRVCRPEDEHHLDDPALARLARIVHAADTAADLGTGPLGPGLLAIGTGGLDVEADDQALLARGAFVYDALYAWCTRQVAAPAGPRT